jgi:hypothetical protein
VHRATEKSWLTESADRSIARAKGREKAVVLDHDPGPPRRLDKQCLLIEVRRAPVLCPRHPRSRALLCTHKPPIIPRDRD